MRTLQTENLKDTRNSASVLLEAIKYASPFESSSRIGWLVDPLGCDALPDSIMNAMQVVELARAGVQVGEHTRTQLFACRNSRFGVDYSERHCDIIRAEGFRLAFTALFGSANCKSDVRQLGHFASRAYAPSRFGIRPLLHFIH